MPDYIKEKRSIINIKLDPNDERCLVFSCTAAIVPRDSRFNISDPRGYVNRLIPHQGVNFPSTLKDVDRLEYLNPSLSICIYAVSEKPKEFWPYRISKRQNKSVLNFKEVNLLLLREGDNHHYVTITKLERLVASTNSKSKQKVFTCRNCLFCAYSKQKMTDHIHMCLKHEPARCIYPEPKSYIKFEKFENLSPLPILIAGDFETNFIETGKKCEQNTSQKQYINKLSCFSYAYKIHINENEAGISNDFPIRNYFAPDEKNCFQNFILSLKKDCFQLGKKLRVYFPLEMSKEDKLIHEKRDL